MASNTELEKLCKHVDAMAEGLYCRYKILATRICQDHAGSPSPSASPGSPGPCQDLVVPAYPDGAWSFFSSPTSHIFPSGNMLVSFVDESGYTSVAHVNRETQEVTKTNLSTLLQADDHNEASLIRRQGDGMLLAAYTRHLSDTYSHFRVSLIPEPKTIADWGPEITIDHGGVLNRTYNQLNYVGGRLFNIIRAGLTSPGQAWYVMYSDDDGDTWSSIFRIHANLPGVSPSQQDNCYCQSTGDTAGNKLWIAANDGFPNHGTITTSQYCYYINASTLNMHNPNGVLIGPIGTPFDLQSDTNASAKVYTYSAPIGRAWNWDIKLDADGVVYVAYQTEILVNPTGTRDPDDRIYYHVSTWNGASWTRRFIGHAGYGISNSSPSYGGGLALDPVEPWKYLFSSNSLDPAAAEAAPPQLTSQWLIYGGEIQWLPAPVTPPETSIDSYFRPRLQVGLGGDTATFVMHGEYTSWNGNYDSVVEAWFCGWDSGITPPDGEDHQVLGACLVVRQGAWVPLVGTGVTTKNIERVLMPGQTSPQYPLRGPVPAKTLRVEHSLPNISSIQIGLDEQLSNNDFQIGARVDSGFIDLEFIAPVWMRINLDNASILDLPPWVNPADFGIGFVNNSDPQGIGLAGQVWVTFPQVQQRFDIKLAPVGISDPTLDIRLNQAATYAYIGQFVNISGDVEYNGATWDLTHNLALRDGNAMSVEAFNSGVLPIRHADIDSSFAVRNCVACVKGASPYTVSCDWDAERIYLRWYDDTGTLVTTEDTNMTASFHRPNTMAQINDPIGRCTLHLGPMRIDPGQINIQNPNFFIFAVTGD